MARRQRERLPEQVAWAKEAIQSRQRRPLSVAEAQQTVRSSMRDPEAVRFRGVRANRATGAVCGWFNAKNGYGAYVGERPFVYYHSREQSEPQIMASNDADLSLSIATLADGMC